MSAPVTTCDGTSNVRPPLKKQYIMMTTVSAIFFAFAVAGTLDTWFYRIGGSDTKYSRLSLWAWTVATTDSTGALNTVTYAVDSDEFLKLTCTQFVDYLKAAEAFAILTCITSLIAAPGFILNALSKRSPIGLINAFLTILFSMITFSLGSAIRNQKFCLDGTTDTYKIDLGINDHNDVGYGFHRGWYFFVIPWVIFVLAFIGTIVATRLGLKADAKAAAAANATTPVVPIESTTETA